MQGVEILASSQFVTEWATDWTAFGITALIIFVIFVFIGVFKYQTTYDVSDIVSYSVVGVVLGLLGGVMIGYILLSTPAAHETQYKITISDEVSMTEFYEHYEVIDQDGKIFTVREKKQ
jgi:hypothetical protein